MVEPNEAYVNTLLNMGFVDSAQIRKALSLAKNDLNDAVALLTGEETRTSFYFEDPEVKDTETQHGIDDGGMDIPPLVDSRDNDESEFFDASGEPPPSYDEAMNPAGMSLNGASHGKDETENMDIPLEFPTTNLYELEDRVFIDNWSIPYKREESLGKCLLSSARFAQEGLADADENCKRFMDRALPECFKKLLTTQAVHRWGSEIHEGIYDMLHLLLELIASRLKYKPVPFGLLELLTQAFNPETEFQFKNRSKPWDKKYFEGVFGADDCYAVCPPTSVYYTSPSYKPQKSREQDILPKVFKMSDCSLHPTDVCYELFCVFGNFYASVMQDTEDPYGWLVNLINKFAELGGFEEIKKQIETAERVDAPMLAALLKPLGICASYLNAKVLPKVFSDVFEKTLGYIQELTNEDMKQKAVGDVFDLLTTLKLLCMRLWQNMVSGVDDLRLEVALKMLKSPHFNAKMNSLKEVCKLIDDSEKSKNPKVNISQDVITEWLLQNKVLSIAFESNLHQSQYCDRIKVLVEFLGTKLSLDELTTIWKMQVGKHHTEVDNIHNILATAAVRFNSNQLDHLFVLIQQSWGSESDRMKEKLLILIGRIGKEARVGKITTKVLDLLWSLSHLPSLTTEMVDQALKSHIEILSDSYSVKEQIKKNYAIKCVDDMKKGVLIVPAIRQLLKITRGMVKQQFNKNDKGNLQELHKSHDIIKLTVTSLVNCHQQAVAAAAPGSLEEDTLVDGRYTHKEFISIHLRFLAYVLEQGRFYLHWHRARDIWDCLVANADACEFDRETCFDWFYKGQDDLDSETQSQMFTSKVLKLEPNKLTMKGFNCFKKFLEKVNTNDHRMKETGSTYTVDKNAYTIEKMELVGLDYLWRVVLEVPSEEIAMLAVKKLMELSYTCLSPKLKKDPVNIHKKFILECYKRLESMMCGLGNSSISQAACTAATAATAVLTPDVIITPVPARANVMLSIERLLVLVEQYIITVEDLHAGPRTLLPHGASFHGYPITINVSSDLPRQEFTLQCHSNESLKSIRNRVANRLNTNHEQIQLSTSEKLLLPSKDQKLLYQLEFEDEQLLFAKVSVSGVTTVPTKEEAESQEAMRIDESSASGSNRQSYALEQERMMPGVIMATECKAFDKLYQLTDLEEPTITVRVQRLLMLLPTDPDVQEALESISQQYTISCSPGSVDDRMQSTANLQNMFKCVTPGMSPFRILYNLEVLSSKLMPTLNRDGGANARMFKENFLAAGGLSIVVNILQKDMFPQDVDTEIRRGCYAICLQLARFLLCGQSSENSFTAPPTSPYRESATAAASPIAMATGTMDTDLNDSLNNSAVEAKRPRSSSVIDDVHPSVRVAIETMGRDDFAETIACFMRVAWAAAAGRINLAGGRQRLSSQSSDEEAATMGGGAGSDTESVRSFRSSVSNGIPSEVTSKDVVIVAEALQLLVLCLQLRTQLMGVFYYLPNVNDFIVEILIGSINSQVRTTALEQLLILSQTPVGDPKIQTPNHFLLSVMLNSPLPLWTPTVYVRGKNHRLQRHCSQFFDLLSRLLDYLTLMEQRLMKIDPTKMIETEIRWLVNYECTTSLDNEFPLLAGHLKLIKTLFTCEGVDKRGLGEKLIKDILDDFLFPASKLIFDTRSTPNKETVIDVQPKCVARECQVAAHDLLVELADGCAENLVYIVSQLISMHHIGDPAILKEWEFQPPVAPRAHCGFVGLKNAGATCYMNSVLQQLYMQPALREALLSYDDTHPDKESVFFQVQSVFGHLMDSKLQYFAPEQFWKCFKLWGQPVNVREQQDAFEFFSNLTDQLDEILKKLGQEQLFKKTLCGMFADQKICKECNHRYEREEAFHSLQVTVKNCRLEDSLEQFVNGEILEGDNAYFCEKCSERRTTVKRMCIKALPPVLVIQLKRFGYDWEAGRALKFDDHFEFPWVLNMEPYTTEGVARREYNNSNPQAADTDSESGSVTDLHMSASNSSLQSNVSNVSVNTPEIQYELVGVIVHSGQANAGHYYSFIKDRVGVNGCDTKEKWYKFNDIIVEEFDMNEDTLEAECFGGTYKANVYDTVNSYPETRHRYWNGYMLFYESADKLRAMNGSGNDGRLLVRQEAVMEGQRSCPPSPSSSSISSSSGPPSPTRIDGLSQLTALVQKGERKGIFKDKMPAAIQRVVHTENLQFMQNRDVYNVDYFRFVLSLASCNARNTSSDKQTILSVCSLQLAVNFLFHTYFRTTKKLRTHTEDWCSCISIIVKHNSEACGWFMQFLAGDRGRGYVRPFLLECPSQEVRFAFAKILGVTFESFIMHGGSAESGQLNMLIETLLQMCDRDVVDNHKSCSEYFWLMNRYATMNRKTCKHLIAQGAFTKFLLFLVGPNAENGSNRRWSSIQAQEFSHLYSVLAFLVRSCDVSTQITVEPRSLRPTFSDMVRTDPLIPIPSQMEDAIFGVNNDTYIREMSTAICDVIGTSQQIANMFIHCSWCNEHFSVKVLQHIRVLLATVSANDMKYLFGALLDILMVEDPLQLLRIKCVADEQGDGVLAVIKSSNTADSRRAYQCIKFLVQLANKCPQAKDYLLQNTSRWQWAVQWLKRKMNEHYWAPHTSSSNEYSSSRTFQRTSSAADTLAEATALLTELEAKDGEVNTSDEVDDSDNKLEGEDWEKEGMT